MSGLSIYFISQQQKSHAKSLTVSRALKETPDGVVADMEKVSADAFC